MYIYFNPALLSTKIMIALFCYQCTPLTFGVAVLQEGAANPPCAATFAAQFGAQPEYTMPLSVVWNRPLTASASATCITKHCSQRTDGHDHRYFGHGRLESRDKATLTALLTCCFVACRMSHAFLYVALLTAPASWPLRLAQSTKGRASRVDLWRCRTDSRTVRRPRSGYSLSTRHRCVGRLMAGGRHRSPQPARSVQSTDLFFAGNNATCGKCLRAFCTGSNSELCKDCRD